jgi:methylase of polypeptide subunit release factors
LSQRWSEYERFPADAYQTPDWVTEALLPHLPIYAPAKVLEPAAGEGQMAAVLRRHGFEVAASDINTGAAAVITNPPYGMAEQFIAHALDLMEPNGLVAMLLRVDYDSAETRRYLFDAPFAKKVVLTKRIRWIKNSTGSPSFNHAWFVWDWLHKGPPIIGYAP